MAGKPKTIILADGFEHFWAAYPKRVARLDAAKAWAHLGPSPELIGVILTALERQKRQPSWLKDSGQYIPHAGTWIRGERWTDEVENPVPAMSRRTLALAAGDAAFLRRES